MEVKKKWHKCILVRSGLYDDLTDVAADLIVVQLGGGKPQQNKRSGELAETDSRRGANTSCNDQHSLTGV